MPTRTAKSAVALASVVLTASALAGCTAAANEPQAAPTTTPAAVQTPPPEQTSQANENQEDPPGAEPIEPGYRAAVAAFPYPLADGYAFPESAPWLRDSTYGYTGEQVAYAWWACTNLAAATEAADAGDTDTADALLAMNADAKAAAPDALAILEASDMFHPPGHWDDANWRNAGDLGLCGTYLSKVTEPQ